LILTRSPDPQVLIAASFFAVICVIDTLQSRIPNIANASLAFAGLAFNFSASGTGGLVASALGAAAGLALLLLPYLMGGFGAGDVKALAALGALVGPGAILQVFVYMALYGAILAMLHYLADGNLRQKLVGGWTTMKTFLLTRDPAILKPKKHEPMRFPYAAAIALGYYTWLMRGDLM
jgi:prepilin peptidase CpaA